MSVNDAIKTLEAAFSGIEVTDEEARMARLRNCLLDLPIETPKPLQTEEEISDIKKLLFKLIETVEIWATQVYSNERLRDFNGSDHLSKTEDYHNLMNLMSQLREVITKTK